MSRRRGQRVRDPLEQRAARALALVQVGRVVVCLPAKPWREQSWQDATGRTLSELQNPARRPPVPREPIPADLMELAPPHFDLEKSPLRKDASVIEERVSRWTIKHDERASETLDSVRDTHLLFLGGRAVGSRTGSPVHCLSDPSR